MFSFPSFKSIPWHHIQDLFPMSEYISDAISRNQFYCVNVPVWQSLFGFLVHEIGLSFRSIWIMTIEFSILIITHTGKGWEIFLTTSIHFVRWVCFSVFMIRFIIVISRSRVNFVHSVKHSLKKNRYIEIYSIDVHFNMPLNIEKRSCFKSLLKSHALCDDTGFDSKIERNTESRWTHYWFCPEF